MKQVKVRIIDWGNYEQAFILTGNVTPLVPTAPLDAVYCIKTETTNEGYKIVGSLLQTTFNLNENAFDDEYPFFFPPELIEVVEQ